MSPQRAQRVRGVPGVGLRTPDGREWLRWGKGHRWDPETVSAPAGPGWVVARCDHDGGGVALADDDACREMGFRWSVCDGCADDGLATFTVKSCTRPGKWCNPWVVTKSGGYGYPFTVAHVSDGGPRASHATKDKAVNMTVSLFARSVGLRADVYFAELTGFDYLSCFCPLDSPCHVDAIIEEGKRRGVWE